MADRTFYPSVSYGFGRVNLGFNVSGNGTSSSLISTVQGVGQDVLSSITRSALGVQAFVLSTRDKYNKVIFASATVEGTAGVRATVGSIINEGSASAGIGFTVYTWTAAGTAAVDVASPNRIFVSLSLRNSATSNPA